jgi:translation initiation factor IF-1
MVDLKEDEKKENFILDVTLTGMIDNRAFRAVLKNGHSLVAYLPRRKGNEAAIQCNVGDCVRVVMSPFDMSRGAIVVP